MIGRRYPPRLRYPAMATRPLHPAKTGLAPAERAGLAGVNHVARRQEEGAEPPPPPVPPHAVDGGPVCLWTDPERKARGRRVATRHAGADDVVGVIVLAQVLGHPDVVRKEQAARLEEEQRRPAGRLSRIFGGVEEERLQPAEDADDRLADIQGKSQEEPV
eukprot:scaffold27748_cov112-Isochrysis_galbana.AAC.4